MSQLPTYCGLDFGTSNSTVGIAHGDGVELVALEDGQATLPSAVFFDFESGRPSFGRRAIRDYVDGVEGRLMRALKSVLGTPLIDEETMLRQRRIGFRAVLGLLVRHLRATAEAAAGRPIDRVVHGRPVHFVDGDDEADRRAEAILGEIAREAGFAEVSFQYEPIAAALDYERSLSRERLALIADIGGGTSDVSIVRLGPERARRAERGGDILANDGVRIGGTDFDRLLSLDALMPSLGYRRPVRRDGLAAPNHYFHDLASWVTINRLYAPTVLGEIRRLNRDATDPEPLGRLAQVLEHRLGHALALDVEAAKIALADAPETQIGLAAVEAGLGVAVTRAAFEHAVADPVARLSALVRGCLTEAGLAAEAIEAVFLTGGSTLLPAVRRAIAAVVPEAELVDGDRFGSVGIGLAVEAARRYG